MYASVKTIREWLKNPHRFSKAERYVLEPYFESDEFYNQTWDLHHWETSTSDFMLVPIAQAKTFMDWVAAETGHERNIVVPEREIAFSIDTNSPPLFIGTAASKSEFENLVEEYGWKEEDKIKRRKAAKAKKDKKRKEKNDLAMRDYIESVRNARQFLGFGKQACPAKEKPGDEIRFEREKPIFVSIDVEAWEKNHNRVTEIGIAILDTAKIPPAPKLPQVSMADLDLDNLDYENPTRTRATAICELIECRHLRILDHKSLRNGQFVSDAADLFSFGTSEWVRLADVPAILEFTLQFYDGDGNKRKVILVGHDLSQDLAYLRVTGYDVDKIKDTEVIDTTALYKAMKGVHEARRLSAVLSWMGIIFFHLHNAGNDAAYTLQALVYMADRGMPESDHPDSVMEGREAPPERTREESEGTANGALIGAGCIKSQDTEEPRPPNSKKMRKGKSWGNRAHSRPRYQDPEIQPEIGW